MDKKKYAIIANVILLIWYFLAMTVVKICSKYFVEGAFRDEWMFMVIPVVTFLLFVFAGKIGKYIHLIWLSMWFITQFLSHEWYTIFGNGFMGNVENKIKYFKDCIQVVNISGRYVPDLYHIILHVLIILAIVSIVLVSDKPQNNG